VPAVYTDGIAAFALGMGTQQFASFREFYPFYLSQHRNRINRGLHVTGNLLVIALVIAAAVTHIWWLFAVTLAAGYGPAWIGHFFFEHNRPATFRHPFYSLAGDWVVFFRLAAGRSPKPAA
jgi:hypothetical protein